MLPWTPYRPVRPCLLQRQREIPLQGLPQDLLRLGRDPVLQRTDRTARNRLVRRFPCPKQDRPGFRQSGRRKQEHGKEIPENPSPEAAEKAEKACPFGPFRPDRRDLPHFVRKGPGKEEAPRDILPEGSHSYRDGRNRESGPERHRLRASEPHRAEKGMGRNNRQGQHGHP